MNVIASETKSQIDQIKEAELRGLTEASGQSSQRYLASQPKEERTNLKGLSGDVTGESGAPRVDRGHSEKGLALSVRADLSDPIRRVAYCG